MYYKANKYIFLFSKALALTNKSLKTDFSPQSIYIMIAILHLHELDKIITVKQVREYMASCYRFIDHCNLNPEILQLEAMGWLSSCTGKRRAFTTKIYSVEPGLIIFLNTLEKKLRQVRVYKQKESNWHKWIARPDYIHSDKKKKK